MKWLTKKKLIKKNKNFNLFKTLKNFFITDIKIKLICLGLAIVMYAFVGNIQVREKNFTVKVTTTGITDGLIINSNIPDFVTLTAKGKQEVIDALNENMFNVKLDLTGIETIGLHRIKLSYEIPQTMNNFFCSIRIKDGTIPVVIDRITEKHLPVKPRITGQLASGIIVEELISRPDLVTVSGPQSLLETIDSISTKVYDITGLENNISANIELDAPVGTNFVTYSSVEINIILKRESSFYYIRPEMIGVNELRDVFAAEILDEYIKLEIAGDREEVDEMINKGGIAFVNCFEINSIGIYEKTVIFNLPERFKLISSDPLNIRIKITRAE